MLYRAIRSPIIVDVGLLARKIEPRQFLFSQAEHCGMIHSIQLNCLMDLTKCKTMPYDITMHAQSIDNRDNFWLD